CAAAAAGCGFGPGSSSPGTATLSVTRDYGSRSLVDAPESDPPASETVIRFLDRQADLTTRYGGGFVQSIDGLAGAQAGGRRSDWFFYVNGVESPIGSADVRVHGGDRIWWDYRDWTAAMRVPAVVGSWPAPFAPVSSTDGVPARVECATARTVCMDVAGRLSTAGAHAGIEPLEPSATNGARSLRVLVGPWAAIRDDAAVGQLRGGPAANGVFATFEGPNHGQYRLIALDQTAAPVREIGLHAGLVAAVRRGDDPATWIVTGTDAAGVVEAAGLLDEADLHDRYAVAAPVNGRPIGLPLIQALSERAP
ncbi:MAG: DUF4430 domain-containing protein, partial [Actinomycetota bacterium]|nr:DUF4430 domain-containing protein [Actinomycetota bacterium]